MIWTFLLLVLGYASAAFECPCSLDSYGLLTCDRHTIEFFPDDLNIEECNIDPEHVRQMFLVKQSFKQIEDQAFASFINLEVINFDYNEIETISANAFKGLSEVREITLTRNNISVIEEGAFDNLVKLDILDVSKNSLLESYTTSAWHFCDRGTNGSLTIEGDIEVFKNLEKSASTKDYCNYIKNAPSIPICTLNNSTLDCSGQKHLQEMACHISKLDFTEIIFDFPMDYEPPFVENYYEGETKGFIMDFNSVQGNRTQLLEKITLFHSKFDLSSLPSFTSTRTKEVLVKADTVFLTEPLTISHALTIHARTVSINSTISMRVSKNQFLNIDNLDVLEFWAPKEETFIVGRALMRKRRLGLVEILDQQVPDTPPFLFDGFCMPQFINSSQTVVDLTGWFDKTFLNLNYVVARTIQSSGSNLKLAGQIADFTLDFAYRLEDINDVETYMAAQKFEFVRRFSEQRDIHNVPSYSLNTVTSLTQVMVEKMNLYRINELFQEEQLSIAMGRMETMQMQFDIVEQQQKLYFQLELAVLEAIWAATDNSWNFSFDHRNSIEDTIMGAMNASTEAGFQMKQNEFKELLAKAEANVEHMTDVLEQYKKEEGRLQQMANASMHEMITLSKNLKSKVSKMNDEVDSFQSDIEDWTHEQEMQAAVSAIFSIFKAFVDVMRGRPFAAAADIANVIKKIKEIIELVNQLVEILDSIDIGGLDGLADPLPTDFKSALHSSTELAKKGPKFDEIKNMAMFRMPAFEEATENEVDGSKAMEACGNVADAGHRITDATSQFADIMLKLADKKGQIRVATADLGRAIEEVTRIKIMLDELEEHREDYANYMEEAQRKYEEEVERMKEEYQNMSDDMREAFKLNITAKFEEYQEVFKQMKADYQETLNSLIESIIEKGYGLKRHSMTQRGMIMELYIDFCDAYFYHSFSICDSSSIPLMSDELETLLDKLADIKWDSITSSANLPGDPQTFGPVPIWVEDDLDSYLYPISILKNSSKININLKDYDSYHYLDEFWRVRISMFRVILLDESDNPIKSPGVLLGEEIQSRITYPTVFNDTDFLRDSHTFLSQTFFCAADYVTDAGPAYQPQVGCPVDSDHEDLTFRSCCLVDDEFSDKNYKPSHDGVYTIELKNAEMLEMDKLAKLQVEFAGSYIPYNG